MSPDIIERIQKALNLIRPFLIADGGDVELVEVTDDLEVRLKLLGNCHGCEMSKMTMKAGIEVGLKNAIPEITNVVAIN